MENNEEEVIAKQADAIIRTLKKQKEKLQFWL